MSNHTLIRLHCEKQTLAESEERLQMQLEAIEQQLAAVQSEGTQLQESHSLELERMRYRKDSPFLYNTFYICEIWVFAFTCRSEWEVERAAWQEKFSNTAVHIQSNREKLLRARRANKKVVQILVSASTVVLASLQYFHWKLPFLIWECVFVLCLYSYRKSISKVCLNNKSYRR